MTTHILLCMKLLLTDAMSPTTLFPLPVLFSALDSILFCALVCCLQSSHYQLSHHIIPHNALTCLVEQGLRPATPNRKQRCATTSFHPPPPSPPPAPQPKATSTPPSPSTSSYSVQNSHNLPSHDIITDSIETTILNLLHHHSLMQSIAFWCCSHRLPSKDINPNA